MSSFFSVGEDELDFDDEVKYTLMYFTVIFFFIEHRLLLELMSHFFDLSFFIFSTIIIFFSSRWLKYVQIEKTKSVLYST